MSLIDVPFNFHGLDILFTVEYRDEKRDLSTDTPRNFYVLGVYTCQGHTRVDTRLSPDDVDAIVDDARRMWQRSIRSQW